MPEITPRQIPTPIATATVVVLKISNVRANEWRYKDRKSSDARHVLLSVHERTGSAEGPGRKRSRHGGRAQFRCSGCSSGRRQDLREALRAAPETLQSPSDPEATEAYQP